MKVQTGYSGLQIGLHWLVALLVMFQLVFGESMTVTVDAAEEHQAVSGFDQGMATAHYWIGLSILALVVVRLAVRLVRGAPAHQDRGWMALAAKAAHWLFYVLLFAVPASGLLAFYVGDPFGDLHSLAKPVFIVLITVHAAAALFHQFYLKDGTLNRILVSRTPAGQR